jgi:subtilisin family serine protease
MKKNCSVTVGFATWLAIMVSVIWSGVLCSSPAGAQDLQYQPGEVIVKFTGEAGRPVIKSHHGIISMGTASLDEVLAKYEIYRAFPLFPQKQSELGLIYQLEFPKKYDSRAVAEDFSGDEHLCYAVVRSIKKLYQEPNDPNFLNGDQWYLNTVRATEAWDVVQANGSVIIAIVDSGVDYDHPDLWDNIWLNSGEDIDGDGRVTWKDWNNVDDDGNGYRDDFFGWDFGGAGGGDNDPNENAAVHGTHCAGIAAAVTDNGLGVAGMSWNARIMPVKANRDGENNIRWGYEGILYAADNGADVISLSWGNTSTSAFEQEMIDSAFARGAIVVAAAGNDPGVTPPDICSTHYPAGNAHVTAVAATDIGDRVTGWSYYGSWVDVAAPGSNIYNTWWNDTYQTLQGTSMSCPLVAGIAALMKTLDADLDSDQFEAKMRNTSDDISAINPTYVGRIGGGRANACAAVQSLTLPRLILNDEFTILDVEGNGDGRPDAGETVDWIVSLHNVPTWQPAEQVWARASCADASISFVRDSTGFGDVGPGSGADNSASPFRFSVAPDAQAHWTTFSLRIGDGTGGYQTADSLKMMIGRPELLVVDDDGGNDLQETLLEDLDRLSVVYDRWDVDASTKFGLEELPRYAVVVWMTGDETENTLTPEDQAALSDFLEGGGHLFLNGENIGDEIGESSFFSDVIMVAHRSDTVWNLPPVVSGIGGDVITDGAQLFLWGPFGPLASPSGVGALGDAVEILTYQNDPQTQAAAVRYQSPEGYRVVYFGFGYEGIRTAGDYTPSWVILENILNWFGLETHPVGVDPASGESQPGNFSLDQNYPNPFNAHTTIRYQIPSDEGIQWTTLCIYNLLGQKVRTLVDERQAPGRYEVVWNGRDRSGQTISSAVYFYRLTRGEHSLTKKMVLLR